MSKSWSEVIENIDLSTKPSREPKKLSCDEIADMKEKCNPQYDLTVLDLICTIEALRQENEQLKAREAREAVKRDVKEIKQSLLCKECLKEQQQAKLELEAEITEFLSKNEAMVKELNKKYAENEQLRAQVGACKDFILELIRRFEETPLDADGTHKLIVNRTFLIEAKAILERKVDTDGIYR